MNYVLISCNLWALYVLPLCHDVWLPSDYLARYYSLCDISILASIFVMVIEFWLYVGNWVSSLWLQISSVFVTALNSIFVTTLSCGLGLDFSILKRCFIFAHSIYIMVVSCWDILKKFCAILFQSFFSFYPWRLILKKLSGNFQSVTCFVFFKNVNYHETWISLALINYATYWVLGHHTL